jgi:antirestriction protein ArdC
MESTLKIAELYQKVTNSIIAELEAGNLPPWLKPWREGRRTGIIPINAATRRSYNGLNILVLWAERDEKGYGLNEWLTFKQALDLGGNVRKGQKATHVIYANKHVIEDGDEQKVIPFLKCYAVFNVSQCEGLPHNEPEPELPAPERNERAEQFFAATGAEVRWGEQSAAYIPSKDIIVMPERGAFHTPEGLYATWAHESIHWTGHKDRLNRELKGRFNERAYSFEELVAEIGAAMACATLQITGELRHATYIESWLPILKDDPRAILTAASLASKACDYLHSFSAQKEAA